jgi:hypothetical protein
LESERFSICETGDTRFFATKRSLMRTAGAALLFVWLNGLQLGRSKFRELNFVGGFERSPMTGISDLPYGMAQATLINDLPPELTKKPELS